MPDQGAKPAAPSTRLGLLDAAGYFFRTLPEDRTGRGSPEAPYELRKQPLRKTILS
jgi:hypothetical protein